MVQKIVIENVLLRGAQQNDLQRVATVYHDGEEYYVYAPPRATGNAIDWISQFTVRARSKGDFNLGREVSASDDLAIPIISRVADELKRLALDSDIWNWGNDSARFYPALICLHGHMIHSDGRDAHLSDKRDEHCEACGSRCVRACPHCKAPIRGKPVMSHEEYTLPMFCYNCGRAYPWMEDRLETARDLLWHDDKLDLEDRERLWGLLKFVMSDPKSDLVPAKKKLIEIDLGKAATATRNFVIDLMAKYAAEMSQP